MPPHLRQAQARLELVLEVKEPSSAFDLEVRFGLTVTVRELVRHELARSKGAKVSGTFPCEHSDSVEDAVADGGKEIQDVGEAVREVVLGAYRGVGKYVRLHESSSLAASPDSEVGRTCSGLTDSANRALTPEPRSQLSRR